MDKPSIETIRFMENQGYEYKDGKFVEIVKDDVSSIFKDMFNQKGE